MTTLPRAYVDPEPRPAFVVPAPPQGKRLLSLAINESPYGASPEAMEALAGYDWPGNVRELKNLVESMVIFHQGDTVEVEDLPPEVSQGRSEPRAATPQAGGGEGRPRTMDEIERQAILETLSRTGGHRAQAAHLLGIGLRTLQRKLKDYKDQGYWND